MATLALTVAGSAIAVPVGGYVGGILGAYIDSQILFKPDQPQGQKVEGIPRPQYSEGTPIYHCLGPWCRVPGTIIWAGPDKKVKKKVSNSAKGGPPDAEKIIWKRSFAAAWCKDITQDADIIWGNGDVEYNRGVEGKNFGGLVTYTGEYTQTADPTITVESDAGAFLPAYRGYTYSVFTDYKITNTGNQIPQLSALVREADTCSLQRAVTRIMDLAGISSSDYDVTRLTGCVTGYVFSGLTTVMQALEPLLLVFNVLIQEQNSKLVFFHADDQDVIVVPDEDIGADSGGAKSGISWKDSNIRQAPGRLVVSYTDPAKDFERRTQTAFTAKDVSQQQVEYVSLEGMTLLGSEASKLARRLLWKRQLESRTASFTLPVGYANVQPGDLLRTSEGDIRVTRSTLGTNYVVEIEGTKQDPDVYSQDSISSDDDTLLIFPYTPPSLHFFPIDVGALTVAEIDEYGFYWGIAPVYANSRFRGAQLYRSKTSGGTFKLEDEIVTALTYGYTETQLADAPDNILDVLNTVDVVVANGELSSVSLDELYSGENWAMVGNELIGFQTATLNSSDEDGDHYTLSNLLRGRRDTFAYTADHAEQGEYFILLDSTLAFLRQKKSDSDKQRYYKAVADGSSESEVDEQEVTVQCRANLPFAPSNFTGTHDLSSGDRTFTWERTSRDPNVSVTDDEIPHLENKDRYVLQVDFDDGNGFFTVHQGNITITDDVYSFDYSWSDWHTSDGWSGSSTEVLTFRIAQKADDGRLSNWRYLDS